LLVKPPWRVLLQPAAARVVEDGHRRLKEIAQPEVASAGEMLAISRTNRDSAQDAIRTARHDDIGNGSRTFCWPPVWRPALAAIG
jgi:hypothetical protein